MDSITAIEPQKRRPNRRSIFVNGAFAAGVHQEVVLNLGIKVGQKVDENRLREMLRAEESRKAREDALNLLSYRSRSAKELGRRLKQKGYDEEVITDVMAGLERVDLVNDGRFAGDWVAGRMASRPMGRVRLLWELRQKGVAEQIVEQALEDIDERQEFEAALALAESKAGRLSGADILAEKRKIAAFLRRRGFSWAIVRRALAQVFPKEDGI